MTKTNPSRIRWERAIELTRVLIAGIEPMSKLLVAIAKLMH